MLTHLTLRNFRAFKSQRFDFARINVFVGPNNSGKSSALSAINLLAQTAEDNEANVTLILRGRFEDLGTFHDVVHGNNANTPLSLEFGIGGYTSSSVQSASQPFCAGCSIPGMPVFHRANAHDRGHPR